MVAHCHSPKFQACSTEPNITWSDWLGKWAVHCDWFSQWGFYKRICEIRPIHPVVQCSLLQSPVDNVFRVKVNRVGQKKRQLSVQFPGLLGGWKIAGIGETAKWIQLLELRNTWGGALTVNMVYPIWRRRCSKSLETFALWVGSSASSPKRL